MPIKNKIGYDTVLTYREEELIRMYLTEGRALLDAKKKAREVALVINNMATKERLLWRNVRENEMTVGTDPELLEEYNNA